MFHYGNSCNPDLTQEHLRCPQNVLDLFDVLLPLLPSILFRFLLVLVHEVIKNFHTSCNTSSDVRCDLVSSKWCPLRCLFSKQTIFNGILSPQRTTCTHCTICTAIGRPSVHQVKFKFQVSLIFFQELEPLLIVECSAVSLYLVVSFKSFHVCRASIKSSLARFLFSLSSSFSRFFVCVMYSAKACFLSPAAVRAPNLLSSLALPIIWPNPAACWTGEIKTIRLVNMRSWWQVAWISFKASSHFMLLFTPLSSSNWPPVQRKCLSPPAYGNTQITHGNVTETERLCPRGKRFSCLRGSSIPLSSLLPFSCPFPRQEVLFLEHSGTINTKSSGQVFGVPAASCNWPKFYLHVTDFNLFVLNVVPKTGVPEIFQASSSLSSSFANPLKRFSSIGISQTSKERGGLENAKIWFISDSSAFPESVWSHACRCRWETRVCFPESRKLSYWLKYRYPPDYLPIFLPIHWFVVL